VTLTNRRELFGAVAAGLVACRVEGVAPAGPARRPGVLGVADLEPPTQRSLEPEAARRAVAGAVAAAMGAESAVAACKALFGPADTVGIKLSCLAGADLSPRPELVAALADLLAEAGVRRDRIIVFERSSRELERAGFEIRRSGDGPYLCFGVDNDWERQPTTSGAIGSCFARLVTERCTALVGFGVVKDHDLAGVSASLKNWYGVIHNPNKYHDSCCDPYVADVVAAAPVRTRLRLTLLDGVTAQCQGGPAFSAEGLFAPGKVVASTDPVAPDAWALRVVDAERRLRGLPTLEESKRPPRFIATADRYGLGVGELARITEVKV
jgi:uncharacterized protein (DUF362 family)